MRRNHQVIIRALRGSTTWLDCFLECLSGHVGDNVGGESDRHALQQQIPGISGGLYLADCRVLCTGVGFSSRHTFRRIQLFRSMAGLLEGSGAIKIESYSS